MMALSWGDVAAILSVFITGAAAIVTALWRFGARLKASDDHLTELVRGITRTLDQIAAKVELQSKELADVKILAVEAATRAEAAEVTARDALAAAHQVLGASGARDV